MIISGGIKLKIKLIFISTNGYPVNWGKNIEGIPALSRLPFEFKLDIIFSISILFCGKPNWFPKIKFIFLLIGLGVNLIVLYIIISIGISSLSFFILL